MKYLSECKLSKIVKKLKSKQITPFELLEECCKKYKEYDNFIKSFLPETVDCLRLKNDLRILLKEKNADFNRYPFLGIPIGIKDIFHVEGFKTQAGSNLPAEILTGKEASIVTKLKKLGALIFGKTVTTEFAYFMAGETKNPHNILHTPGGSSSGSAAAVAAGIVPWAIGSQTIGSVIRPASYCGIYGFKPSQGRIPTNGMIAFSPSVDQIGFFAQDLKSIIYASAVICSEWKPYYFTKSKIRIGIPSNEYLNQAEDYILGRFGKFIQKLESIGLQVQTFDILKNVKNINDLHGDLIANEFYAVHKIWFEKYSHLYSKKATELYEKGRKITPARKEDILFHKKKYTEEITDFTKREEIDLWFMPATTSIAPKGLTSTGNPIMNLPWTFFGFPTVSVPLGFIKNMPWAIQAVGLQGKDEELLAKLNIILEIVMNEK